MIEEATVKTAGNNFKTALQVALALAFAGAVLAGASKQSQTAPNAKEQLTPLIRSVKGPDLFRAYCASCHGVDAKGGGPAASALKAKVPDLTLLARKNRGQFPAVRVREAIMGDKIVAAHGSREMPIWGPVFHQIEYDMDWGNVRLANLVEFLQSIQSVRASDVSSGAELYQQHCAVCHGNDLKGTGAVPEPYKPPPDLTTLAQRHSGKFPDEYVASVLRNGVIIRAHGLAEMAIWGTDFKADGLNEPQAASRITNLTEYIRSFQK